MPSHPEDAFSSPIEEEKPQFKRPEFILIDDRNGKEKITYFKEDSPQSSHNSFEKAEAPKSAFSLRFICLLGLIFCFMFGLGMFLWSVTLTALATLSLFQNHRLNQGMRHFWKLFIHTFVAGFSFALGMMSPTLGLGLLALYFSRVGHLVGDDLLRKIIRCSFHHL